MTRRGLCHGYRADADCCCRVGLFLYRKTALRFDLQMFKLKPKYLKNIVVSGFPSLGNQLSIIAMLFFHNYQALKYGRVDGLAAYTFIGAVESLGSLLMTGLALGVQPLVAYLYGGGRLPPAEHYRQHGLLYRFRIGNCADVRIGCRTTFSHWFICTAMRRFLPHTDWLSVRRRSCCWE